MMKQNIRNNTFETNSSSIHSLVIFKEKKEFPTISQLTWLIPIFNSSYSFYLTDPEEIISYLYTLGLASHCWKLVDNLKEKFPNCIFQKPSWDLPYESETGFCDDREIISFCDLNADFTSHFSREEVEEISKLSNFINIIFNGEIYCAQDESYSSCVIKHHNIKNGIEAKEWIGENIEKIWEY